METINRRIALTILASSPLAVTRFLPANETTGAGDNLTMLVMDPLDKELSCPCVKGYAQRDYDALGRHLAQKLKRSVIGVHSESLVGALKNGKLPAGVDLVIGKRSVVEYDARQRQIDVTPIASLTGKDGLTTQLGLIVVPSKDPAKSLADLKDYRIIFGPEDCDEKHKAAITVLKQQGVSLPEKLETCAACADGATMILELGQDVRAATVISSYAAPLLEGCGTIQKGDLRVIGKTAPVPFVTAFTTSRVADSTRDAIREVLLELIENPKLCIALETQQGFVALAENDGLAKKK